MMYNNKLAVAIKHKGKVLREVEDTVYIPFGSEYSIFVKNLNSVRALVNISIDGVDVGEGDFVVRPNDSIDIERFIKDGNLTKGNRFKFIERSESVEQHRGIGVEDGLIRIEFKFEKPYVFPRSVCKSPSPGPFLDWDSSWNCMSPTIGNPRAFDTLITSNSCDYQGDLTVKSVASYSANVSEQTFSVADVQAIVNEAGITVPGSVSDQQFTTASWFPTEDESHVIVLKMLGETEKQKVKKAITVKTKPKCVTCGKTNKATSKFCSNCGTSLTIV